MSTKLPGPMLRPGARVVIQNLRTRIDLNNSEGELLRWMPSRQRWATRVITTGERILVQVPNLLLCASLFERLGATSDDILSIIVANLTSPELIRIAATCTAWARTVLSDATWGERCEALWLGKLHVERWRGDTSIPRRVAYFESLRDSTRRDLRPEELCAIKWHARVKGHSFMTDECPWWNGLQAGHRIYKLAEDGGGEHCGPYISSERGEGFWKLRPTDPTLVYTFRDAWPHRPHVASRCPYNWGWLLQSQHGFSASFPLPPRGVEPSLEDGGALDIDFEPHEDQTPQADAAFEDQEEWVSGLVR